MGTLYLVRHGQASFGAEDYDNLSELGHRQSVRLGEYFRQKNIRFDAVLCGTLRRHVQTWEGIRKGAAVELEPLPWPGLNEFDGDALIAAINPHPMERPDSPEMAKQHFRLLRDGLTQWMNGVVSPKGMHSYPEFVKGVSSALEHVRQHHTGNVLMVSSGGPISTAVGHILGTTPETTIGLNLRIRNSSLTEFAFNHKHYTLATYNTLPHLEQDAYADWVTFA